LRCFAFFAVLALIISACGVSRGSDLAAASITFSDGSTVSIDGNEFREVSGSIRGSEDFLALSGLPADTIDTLSLTQMVQAEVVTHLLDINGASISSADLVAGRDDLKLQLDSLVQQGAPALTGEDGQPVDPAAMAGQINNDLAPYLDVLAVLITSSDALPDVLAANGEAGAEIPCVSHILVEALEEAEEISGLLDDGGDFAELAIERSTDPGSGQFGGELGCSPVDAWVPEFRDAVLAAEVGVVTAPVQSQFGYHIILVTGTESDNTTLGNDALEAEFAEITVDIDPAIGAWDSIGNEVVAATS
jgi:parvulin-like peptidyl-prolyl isomerase